MIVCHCGVVTDKQIKDAIQQGCNTLKCIKEQTKACSDCKGCRPTILKILKDNVQKAK